MGEDKIGESIEGRMHRIRDKRNQFNTATLWFEGSAPSCSSFIRTSTLGSPSADENTPPASAS
jgi:hypothetical protein